ncbi:beta-galactosidase 17 [Phtheirospermum japonicum]|uniref:beta-galactosidase n=1 Tax=Phtheirospermum japonicum TaxID=374723 RepID=A0A830D551_9LAMI|nr:beta-galactosidase 17 [Phtheirospermum japonicum]
MFWKDGEPFRIIGGDLHYFRVHPEYWEDRLMRAKALGLNTIQTYVPWNLHEPRQGHLVFEGIADIISFLELCKKLDLLVMLRAGPYICGEWDLGGFPAWLLAEEPAIRLRSSDPAFIDLVEKWWDVLLPKVSPFLYSNGGPIIMVQVENEFGSYGDDKAYLHYLVKLARKHLGDDIILYTTDGGTRETLEKGTIHGDAVFSALRRVIAKYVTEPLASVPPDNEKIAYGRIKLDRLSFLFDTIGLKDPIDADESENPISMEAIGQMFGFVLYASDYTPKGNGSVLFIPKVENMGRLNYGPYMFDRKGILSPVYLDEQPLYKWKMLPVSFQNLSDARKINPIVRNATREFLKGSARKQLKDKKLNFEPAFYAGQFNIDIVRDTYLSFRGWSKGVAFVNEINIGRFWPSIGPQCNLYVPAPILRQGDNTLVILELESPNPDLYVTSVDHGHVNLVLAREHSLFPDASRVAIRHRRRWDN